MCFSPALLCPSLSFLHFPFFLDVGILCTFFSLSFVFPSRLPCFLYCVFSISYLFLLSLHVSVFFFFLFLILYTPLSLTFSFFVIVFFHLLPHFGIFSISSFNLSFSIFIFFYSLHFLFSLTFSLFIPSLPSL